MRRVDYHAATHHEAASKFFVQKVFRLEIHHATKDKIAVPPNAGIPRKTHLRIPAARCARVVPISSAQQRAWGMPGAQCTRSLACKMKKHTSVVTTGPPELPDIPARNGFN
jgi:hypothetical protein